MLEDIVPIAPVHFFALQFDCHYFKGFEKNVRFLPDLHFLNTQDSFAELAMAWSEKGLYFYLNVKRPLLKVNFPDLQHGDSLELFIDTRDVKTSGYNTRFCHHFYFLPEAVEEGIQAGEITRFRNDDAHELCDPRQLIVAATSKRTQYSMNIFIPAECLNGFDPAQFNRLGFTYRINRFDGEPQCFSVNSRDFSIEQQPSTWASLKLI